MTTARRLERSMVQTIDVFLNNNSLIWCICDLDPGNDNGPGAIEKGAPEFKIRQYNLDQDCYSKEITVVTKQCRKIYCPYIYLDKHRPIAIISGEYRNRVEVDLVKFTYKEFEEKDWYYNVLNYEFKRTRLSPDENNCLMLHTNPLKPLDKKVTISKVIADES